MGERGRELEAGRERGRERERMVVVVGGGGKTDRHTDRQTDRGNIKMVKIEQNF